MNSSSLFTSRSQPEADIMIASTCSNNNILTKLAIYSRPDKSTRKKCLFLKTQRRLVTIFAECAFNYRALYTFANSTETWVAWAYIEKRETRSN